jgi:hypothetical protein
MIIRSINSIRANRVAWVPLISFANWVCCKPKKPMPRDPFIREKFTMERTAAKKLAAEYFQRSPKERYQTEVESWRHLQSQNIEFTMKRLREPIEGAG